MYIDGTIGVDIIGSEFAKELRQLENLNPISVDVRINSGGGSVIDGYDILDAILESPLNVYTTAYGLAGSMAGVILMAGKKVRMTENGIFMVHSVSGPKNQDVVDKYNASLISIFAGRTNVKRNYLNKLMKGDNYFTAIESLSAGFIDEVLPTKQKVSVDIKNSSIDEIVNVFNKIKNDDMNDTNNELENNVEQIVEVINEVETAPEVVEEVVNEEEQPEEEATPEAKPEEVDLTEMKKQLEDLVKVNEDLLKQLAEVKQAHNTLIEKENTRIKGEKEALKAQVVNAAIEAGKFGEDVKSTWLNFLEIDFDGAKKAIDVIVTNKASVDIMNVVNAGKSAKPDMTLRQLEKTNPKEVARIKTETPEIFNEMYKEEYGVYPSSYKPSI